MSVRWWSETLIPAVTLGQLMKLAQFNPMRIYLGITPIGNGAQLNVSTSTKVASGTAGIVVNGTGRFPQLELRAGDTPQLVIQAWYGSSAAFPPSNAAVVFEEFFDPSLSTPSDTDGILLPGTGQVLTAGEIPDPTHELILSLQRDMERLKCRTFNRQ